MATTPPHGGKIHTPPAPLHGAAYDSYEPYSPRYATRSSNRKHLRQAQVTPEPEDRVEAESLRPKKATPPRKSTSSQSLNSTLSPPHTTRRSPKHKVNGRVYPTSPTSPSAGNMDEIAPAAPQAPETSNPSRTFSSNTTMHEGMLPTPVKTPRKKTIANVEAAARALFQDQPHDLQEVVAAPRRSKKSRRYNGFSLESFAAENGHTTNGIQIFTDSRDKVPEIDPSEDNPFYERGPGKGTSSKKVAGGSKRRKISGESKKDKDVEAAINHDEGMIYVHRGKKVYRKFDSDVEDEEIDSDDHGLLEHATGPLPDVKRLRTLTRKSIKPTRLFQTELENRTREAEKEEEAPTDIEDDSDDSKRTLEVIDLITPKDGSEVTKSSTSTDLAKIQPMLTKGHLESDSDTSQGTSNSKTKKASPFDTWKRVKRGTATEASTASKGKKRAAEAHEEETGKKLKV